jgi:hypothetical protein
MFTAQRYLVASALAAGVMVAAPACASYGYYGSQRSGVYNRDIEQRAYDNGYRDGIRRGEDDSRRGRAFAYDRHGDWKDADDGYHRDYGNQEFYRRVFRRGFETGYREGFNRYARGG